MKLKKRHCKLIYHDDWHLSGCRVRTVVPNTEAHLTRTFTADEERPGVLTYAISSHAHYKPLVNGTVPLFRARRHRLDSAKVIKMANGRAEIKIQNYLNRSVRTGQAPPLLNPLLTKTGLLSESPETRSQADLQASLERAHSALSGWSREYWWGLWFGLFFFLMCVRGSCVYLCLHVCKYACVCRNTCLHVCTHTYTHVMANTDVFLDHSLPLDSLI